MEGFISELFSALRYTKKLNATKQKLNIEKHPKTSALFYIVKDGVAKWEIRVTRIND